MVGITNYSWTFPALWICIYIYIIYTYIYIYTYYNICIYSYNMHISYIYIYIHMILMYKLAWNLWILQTCRWLPRWDLGSSEDGLPSRVWICNLAVPLAVSSMERVRIFGAKLAKALRSKSCQLLCPWWIRGNMRTSPTIVCSYSFLFNPG
jgi:hypothetical protein